MYSAVGLGMAPMAPLTTGLAAGTAEAFYLISTVPVEWLSRRNAEAEPHQASRANSQASNAESG
jgi:hypothetical protein